VRVHKHSGKYVFGWGNEGFPIALCGRYGGVRRGGRNLKSLLTGSVVTCRDCLRLSKKKTK
jgi:hypothetical protein